MRVFLDTNVLVSALTTRGLCADVLQLVVTDHELVTADAVLVELKRIFTRKFKIPQPRADALVQFLSRFHSEPIPHPLPSIPIHDPNDVVVLASAIAARADVVVTGDKDFLVLPVGSVPVRIMDPRTFWTTYRPLPA